MFIIQRAVFCYSVEVQEEGVTIKPLHPDPTMTTAVTSSILKSLTIVANYYSSGLRIAEREAYLQAYFQSKGYTITQPGYRLRLNQPGERKIS